VLRCVVVCCSVLQCVAVCCMSHQMWHLLRSTATEHYSTPQCSVHTATYGNTVQHIATHCTTLHHTASHCNTLQHTATRCNGTCNLFVALNCSKPRNDCGNRLSQLIVPLKCLRETWYIEMSHGISHWDVTWDITLRCHMGYHIEMSHGISHWDVTWDITYRVLSPCDICRSTAFVRHRLKSLRETRYIYLKHIHLFETYTFVWNIYICLKHIHLFETYTFVWNIYIYFKHDTFIWNMTSRLLHMCDMTHSCVRHDSIICGTYFIRMRDMSSWVHEFMSLWVHEFMSSWVHEFMSVYGKFSTWNRTEVYMTWLIYAWADKSMRWQRSSESIDSREGCSIHMRHVHSEILFIWDIAQCYYTTACVSRRLLSGIYHMGWGLGIHWDVTWDTLICHMGYIDMSHGIHWDVTWDRHMYGLNTRYVISHVTSQFIMSREGSWAEQSIDSDACFEHIDWFSPLEQNNQLTQSDRLSQLIDWFSRRLLSGTITWLRRLPWAHWLFRLWALMRHDTFTWDLDTTHSYGILHSETLYSEFLHLNNMGHVHSGLWFSLCVYVCVSLYHVSLCNIPYECVTVRHYTMSFYS